MGAAVNGPFSPGRNSSKPRSFIWKVLGIPKGATLWKQRRWKWKICRSKAGNNSIMFTDFCEGASAEHSAFYSSFLGTNMSSHGGSGLPASKMDHRLKRKRYDTKCCWVGQFHRPKRLTYRTHIPGFSSDMSPFSTPNLDRALQASSGTNRQWRTIITELPTANLPLSKVELWESNRTYVNVNVKPFLLWIRR